jgi:hypothetical protein
MGGESAADPTCRKILHVQIKQSEEMGYSTYLLKYG